MNIDLAQSVVNEIKDILSTSRGNVAKAINNELLVGTQQRITSNDTDLCRYDFL